MPMESMSLLAEVKREINSERLLMGISLITK